MGTGVRACCTREGGIDGICLSSAGQHPDIVEQMTHHCRTIIEWDLLRGILRMTLEGKLPWLAWPGCTYWIGAFVLLNGFPCSNN